MAGDNLKKGDAVVYHDRDLVRWGPWRVLKVYGDVATVQIEAKVSYALPRELLQKTEICSIE